MSCRVDRREAGDDLQGLPTLIRERMEWSGCDPGPGPRALLAVEMVQALVDNGGWYAYFDYYSGPEQFAEAIAAARRLGASPYLPLLEEVRAALPNGIPEDDHDERERLEPVVSAFDDRFYALGRPDLVEHGLRFAAAHPDEFFLTEAEADAEIDDILARLGAHPGTPARVDAQSVLLRRLYAEVGHGDRLLAPTEPVGDWMPFWEESGTTYVVSLADAGAEVGRLDDGVRRWEATSLRGWLQQRVAS